MNDQLQKALADIVKSLTDAAGQVGTVAKEQLPLLVNEYLKWGIVQSAVWIAICVTAVAIALPVGKRARTFFRAKNEAYKRENQSRYGDDGLETATLTLGFLMPICISVAAFIIIAFNVSIALEIYVAPRVYLIDQVKALVK